MTMAHVANKTTHRPTPAELRNMLGANLRQLSKQAVSISALCRDLGINRTQYNRYLSGESFPRPDVLHRICSYFGVDARILLDPVENIATSDTGILRHPAVEDFVGHSTRPLEETEFPSGFYRFVRRSFMDEQRFVQGLIYVFRNDAKTFLRGSRRLKTTSGPDTSRVPCVRMWQAAGSNVWFMNTSETIPNASFQPPVLPGSVVRMILCPTIASCSRSTTQSTDPCKRRTGIGYPMSGSDLRI